MVRVIPKSGGFRPIAIGFTLRRLTAKCANTHSISKLADFFASIQLGVGVFGGCEAAVHLFRRFIESMPANFIVAKLDFTNAFNNLHRDKMLEMVGSKIPELDRFCHQPTANIHSSLSVQT